MLVWIVVAFLLVILGSLAFGLKHLVVQNSQEDRRKLLNALQLRIGLSIALFVLIMILAALGVITPHGVGQ